MADSGKSYNEYKLKLTVAKGQLRKSFDKFEDSCKGLAKDLAKDNLPASSENTVALVINKLSILSEKKDEVRRCREKWKCSIVEYDEEEFEKVSKNQSKNTLIEESQRDAENYEDKADDSIKADDDEVKMAELLLVNAVAPQNQASGGSEVSDQWSALKPQLNLAPFIWIKE